jgi:hypothetical protein
LEVGGGRGVEDGGGAVGGVRGATVRVGFRVGEGCDRRLVEEILSNTKRRSSELTIERCLITCSTRQR